MFFTVQKSKAMRMTMIMKGMTKDLFKKIKKKTKQIMANPLNNKWKTVRYIKEYFLSTFNIRRKICSYGVAVLRLFGR
jgi:hypothetical protein